MKNGFTLIELAIVIAIILIIGWVAFGLLSAGTITWHSGSASLTLQQELRRGLNSMIKELEQTGSTVIDSFANNVPANGVNYNSIIFRVPEIQDTNGNGQIDAEDTILNSNGEIGWSNPITYQLTFNAQLGSFQLTRVQGGATTVLANYLPTQQSAQFRRETWAPNVVLISLQGQKSSPLGHVSSASVSGRAEMRN